MQVSGVHSNAAAVSQLFARNVESPAPEQQNRLAALESSHKAEARAAQPGPDEEGKGVKIDLRT